MASQAGFPKFLATKVLGDFSLEVDEGHHPFVLVWWLGVPSGMPSSAGLQKDLEKKLLGKASIYPLSEGSKKSLGRRSVLILQGTVDVRNRGYICRIKHVDIAQSKKGKAQYQLG